MKKYKNIFKNHIILMVTNDELELPIAVFENCEEMMKFTGKSLVSCYNAIWGDKVDKKHDCKYIKVNIKKEVE